MPLAPSQQQKLIVLLRMWNYSEGTPRYQMQTKNGLLPVESIEEARQYAVRNDCSGIQIIPV